MKHIQKSLAMLLICALFLSMCGIAEAPEAEQTVETIEDFSAEGGV